MTPQERKVMELALEALEYIRNIETDVASQTKYGQAAEAIKEALAQPEQEPVAWEQFYPDIGKPQIEFAPVKIVAYNCTCGRTIKFESEHGVVAPQRKPLTDEEMKKIWYAMQNIMGWYSFQEIARAIEAAHNIKE